MKPANTSTPFSEKFPIESIAPTFINAALNSPTAVTSESMCEISNHLRGLVQLIKSKNIPLDYPDLAKDLFRFSYIEKRDEVRLKWGREFYRIYKEENENEK